MTTSIIADAQAQPHLFRWNGPVVPEELFAWGIQRGWNIPSDLSEFWALTGGGVIFETETLLKPIVPVRDEDGVEHATDWLKNRGMPRGLFVFHEGLCFSAVRCEDGACVIVDERAGVADQYDSLNSWYLQVLRAEYAERYSLGADEAGRQSHDEHSKAGHLMNREKRITLAAPAPRRPPLPAPT